MADQSKWSSSRVAHAKTAQQEAYSGSASNGTQQSRWATTSNASSSSNSPSTSASSSWRSRSNQPSTSASSTWRSSASSTASGGSSGSRWARTSSSTQDSSVSALTDGLSRTSLASQPPPPSSRSTSLASPPPSTTVSSFSMTTRTALPPRSRPLGGKPLDRLALLASPSRGLDSSASLSSALSSQGSMDLTLRSVQEEFREYISTRIAKALPLLSARPGLRVLDSKRYLSTAGKADEVGEGEEELQQVLLLVRKLREALVASRRVDRFAVEAYELSAHLAVLCGDATQLAASLPRLVLELYPATTTATEIGSGDVDALASKLGITDMKEGRRLRMVGLYLLQTLCSSGRATRLGQYTSGSEPLSRGFSEYRHLRASLSSLYGDALDPHLETCDVVYTALRDVDPFALARVLAGGALDGWQRLIVLSVVPALRSAAWGVAKKAYMYLPVSERFVGMMRNDAAENGGVGADERWLIGLLMLGINVLPDTSAQVANEKTPDDWDADADDPSINDQVERTRLLHFLTAHLAPLTDRIMPLKQGSAIKLR